MHPTSVHAPRVCALCHAADNELTRVHAIAAEGTSVLLSKQNVVKALAVADRAYVLDLGRVADDATPAELRACDSLRATLFGG